MSEYTRAYQKKGDFTALEISEKAFHDKSVELIQKQIDLIGDQKKFGETIRTATIWTAIATVVMSLAMIVTVYLQWN